MVGAPESRLLPTKIIIAFALPREMGTQSPDASCSIPVAARQVGVGRYDRERIAWLHRSTSRPIAGPG